MLSFIERLRALPPELYDKIYDLTFAPKAIIVRIDDSYCPPNALQVSKATRKKFSESYYGDSMIFYVPQNLYPRWLGSMKRDEVKLHCEIRITETFLRMDNHSVALFYNDIRDKIMDPHLYAYSPYLEDVCVRLKFQVVFGEAEKRAWISLEDFIILDPDADCKTLSAAEMFEGLLQNGYDELEIAKDSMDADPE